MAACAPSPPPSPPKSSLKKPPASKSSEELDAKIKEIMERFKDFTIDDPSFPKIVGRDGTMMKFDDYIKKIDDFTKLSKVVDGVYSLVFDKSSGKSATVPAQSAALPIPETIEGNIASTSAEGTPAKSSKKGKGKKKKKKKKNKKKAAEEPAPSAATNDDALFKKPLPVSRSPAKKLPPQSLDLPQILDLTQSVSSEILEFSHLERSPTTCGPIYEGVRVPPLGLHQVANPAPLIDEETGNIIPRPPNRSGKAALHWLSFCIDSTDHTFFPQSDFDMETLMFTNDYIQFVVQQRGHLWTPEQTFPGAERLFRPNIPGLVEKFINNSDDDDFAEDHRRAEGIFENTSTLKKYIMAYAAQIMSKQDFNNVASLCHFCSTLALHCLDENQSQYLGVVSAVFANVALLPANKETFKRNEGWRAFKDWLHNVTSLRIQ